MVSSKLKPDQPLDKLGLQLAAEELLNHPAPQNTKYLVMVILENGLAYLYRLIHIDGHQNAFEATLSCHRNSGRPATGPFTCVVQGSCRDVTCNCGGSLRTITYKGLFSS